MTNIPKINSNLMDNSSRLPFVPVGGADTLKKQSLEFPDQNRIQRSNFNELFKNELNKLKFSGHAISRVESRELEVTDTDFQRLNKAFQIAESKGSKNPLIMIDDKAFIVNVPNKTIVTVMEKSKLENNAITNIDSAIFV